MPSTLHDGKIWFCRWFYTEANKEFVPFTGTICENFSLTQVIMDLLVAISKIFVGHNLPVLSHSFKLVSSVCYNCKQAVSY